MQCLRYISKTIVGPNGPFEPPWAPGENGHTCEHLRQKCFHFAFKSLKLAQQSHIPDKIWILLRPRWDKWQPNICLRCKDIFMTFVSWKSAQWSPTYISEQIWTPWDDLKPPGTPRIKLMTTSHTTKKERNISFVFELLIGAQDPSMKTFIRHHFNVVLVSITCCLISLFLKTIPMRLEIISDRLMHL